VIPKWLIIKLKWLFWRFEWLLVISLSGVIVIDRWIYYNFITIGATFGEKIQVFTIIASLTSIVVAAVTISYQVDATKRKEIQFKLHDQHKGTNEELLKFIEEIFKNTKEKDKEKSAAIMEEIGKKWMNTHFHIMVYSSPQIINTYKAIRDAGIDKRDTEYITAKLAELFIQMRKEAGFAEEDVPSRKLLSLFINDIYKKDYDKLFDKQGYIIQESNYHVVINRVKLYYHRIITLLFRM